MKKKVPAKKVKIRPTKQSDYSGQMEALSKYRERIQSSTDDSPPAPGFLKHLEREFQAQKFSDADAKSLVFNLIDGLGDLVEYLHYTKNFRTMPANVRRAIISNLLNHAANHLATAAFIYSGGERPFLLLDKKDVVRIAKSNMDNDLLLTSANKHLEANSKPASRSKKSVDNPGRISKVGKIDK